MSHVDVVGDMVDELKSKYSEANTQRFTNIIGAVASVEELRDAPVAVQLRTINHALDKELAKIARTTEVRSWLNSDCTPEIYIREFQNHWAKGLVDTGILSDEVKGE